MILIIDHFDGMNLIGYVSTVINHHWQEKAYNESVKKDLFQALPFNVHQ